MMDVDSGAAMAQLVKRQSSFAANAAAEILGSNANNAKPRPVEFTSDFV